MYQGKEISTTVKDDAGKFAQWNEKFVLKNVMKSIKHNEPLILQAYDKDPIGADHLGEI
jgi:hypothetical protein